MVVPSRREMPGTGRVGCTTDRFWRSSPEPGGSGRPRGMSCTFHPGGARGRCHRRSHGGLPRVCHRTPCQGHPGSVRCHTRPSTGKGMRTPPPRRPWPHRASQVRHRGGTGPEPLAAHQARMQGGGPSPAAHRLPADCRTPRSARALWRLVRRGHPIRTADIVRRVTARAHTERDVQSQGVLTCYDAGSPIPRCWLGLCPVSPTGRRSAILACFLGIDPPRWRSSAGSAAGHGFGPDRLTGSAAPPRSTASLVTVPSAYRRLRKSSTRWVRSAVASGSYDGSELSANRCCSPG